MTNHYDLQLVTPKFNSTLTDLIIEFEFLQRKILRGTTPPKVFFQLKELFYMLESIQSARIEGNNTTVLDYVQQQIQGGKNNTQSFKEIQNIELCISLIQDMHPVDIVIDRSFICELHKRIVRSLDSEGSKTPGEYRKQNIIIAKSTHTPPDFTQVNSYMEELCNFIQEEHDSKYQLLKVAIAHHRFSWIHPFDNGNGRTVRLLTYAMLIKIGFVTKNRIINPTAVFCSDRNKYYEALAKADTGEEEQILNWCEYMLKGLKRDFEKIELLCDYKYLQTYILSPAIKFAYESGFISLQEARILGLFTIKHSIKAGDLPKAIGNDIPASLSRILKRMQEKSLILPEQHGKRRYVINLKNNYLLTGLIQSFKTCGLLRID